MLLIEKVNQLLLLSDDVFHQDWVKLGQVWAHNGRCLKICSWCLHWHFSCHMHVFCQNGLACHRDDLMRHRCVYNKLGLELCGDFSVRTAADYRGCRCQIVAQFAFYHGLRRQEWSWDLQGEAAWCDAATLLLLRYSTLLHLLAQVINADVLLHDHGIALVDFLGKVQLLGVSEFKDAFILIIKLFDFLVDLE